VDSKNFDSHSLNSSVHFRKKSTNQKKYLNNIRRTCHSTSKNVWNSIHEFYERNFPINNIYDKQNPWYEDIKDKSHQNQKYKFQNQNSNPYSFSLNDSRR